MSGGYTVDEVVLDRSSAAWADQAEDVREGAAQELAGVDSSVFSASTEAGRSPVAAPVSEWLATWEGYSEDLADAFDEVSTKLSDAATAYRENEENGVREFEQWLGGGR